MPQLSVAVRVNGTTFNYAADTLDVAREIVTNTQKLAEGSSVLANAWAHVDGQVILLPYDVTQFKVPNFAPERTAEGDYQF
jgi:hypothetical protein